MSATEDSAVSCFGALDGEATVTASGGTAPYTYLWDNGEATATAATLGAGAHDVTLTDANNCITTASVTIRDAIERSVTVCASTEANCTSCDGTAMISATGGASPYSYSWSNGNTTSQPGDLCSGINTVTVTDANSCTATLEININSISTLLATAAIDSDVSCFSVCDGEATVTASSGNPPYTYLWSDGQTTATASSLCAGSYLSLIHI